MSATNLLLAVLLLGGLAACRSTPPSPASGSATAPAPTPAAAPVPAPTGPAVRDYTLVLLKTGPMSGKLPKEENQQVFAGHFANMERMAKEGQLVVAGPFGERRHDSALRGIFVLDTAQRAEAEAWASTDPPTKAGVFVLEYHDLATAAPLRASLEADFAWRAQQAAEGKTPGPGEGARSYVLLTAENGELAQAQLEPLLGSEGGVFLLAKLDDTRAFALLDAANLDVARERFRVQLESLGSHELDEWYASNQLARLHELGP